MRNYIMIIILAAVIGVALISSLFVLIPKFNAPNPQYKEVVLGQTDVGTVVRYGPYGNTASPNRIAYIVGVHPLEHQAHDALVKSIERDNKSLKNCYYIYRVNVTDNPYDYNIGRTNGQNLANKYVVPDIKNNNIKLVMDVHSNVGNWKEKWFLYIPADSQKAQDIATKIESATSWLTIYTPPDPTSPIYVTIPLIQAGIPSIIYETYTNESVNQTQSHADEVTSIIDELNLN